MLLAIDIGNSDITTGIFYSNGWQRIWRIPSDGITSVQYGLHLQNNFLESDLKISDVANTVISSVVPDVTDSISRVVSNLFGINPVVMGVDVYPRLAVKVMNPYQIGADLVANAVAAYTHFGKACIVVDFGTALTFTAVNGKGEIIGVAIAPGLKTAFKSLAQNTAKLFDVPLEFPASVLGKNTVHAIQAGIMHGYEGIVKNIIEKIRAEIGEEVTVVATGGLSITIPTLKEYVDEIRPSLTLDGLRIVSQSVK